MVYAKVRHSFARICPSEGNAKHGESQYAERRSRMAQSTSLRALDTLDEREFAYCGARPIVGFVRAT
jgi:hypothetical protein